MTLDVFINFDGDCLDALEFYSGVFKVDMPEHIMTYGQAGYELQGAGKDRILYSSLPIFGSNVMLSDCPPGSNFVKGTNIALTLNTTNAAEIERLYVALGEGGYVNMPLGKTFFSELYCMVTDKLGITWQLSLMSLEP